MGLGLYSVCKINQMFFDPNFVIKLIRNGSFIQL